MKALCEVLLIYAYSTGSPSPIIYTKCATSMEHCKEIGMEASANHPLRNLEKRCEMIGLKVDNGREE